MDANRFYSIPYDARNDTAVKKLRKKHGGMAAFGRWQALLGVLYDEGGVIDLNDDDNRSMVEDEIELRGDRLDAFIGSCAKFGLLSDERWDLGQIASDGVCRELEYKRKKQEAGSKGGKSRKDDAK